MENTRTFTGNTEAEIWQQVVPDMARQGNELGYAAVLQQGAYHLELDVDIDPGGGFEGGFETTTLTARVPAIVALRFALHEQDWVHELGKLLGMTDIQLGDPEIDAAFMIKTNDPSQLHALLADPAVRQTLLRYPGMRLVLDTVTFGSEDELQLEFSIDTAIVETSALQEIYHLLLTLLQQIAPPAATAANG